MRQTVVVTHVRRFLVFLRYAEANAVGPVKCISHGFGEAIQNDRNSSGHHRWCLSQSNSLIGLIQIWLAPSTVDPCIASTTCPPPEAVYSDGLSTAILDMSFSGISCFRWCEARAAMASQTDEEPSSGTEITGLRVSGLWLSLPAVMHSSLLLENDQIAY